MSFLRKFRISNFEFRIWQFNKQSFSTNNGFTLIELLVVMSIIAILIASATYSWQNAQQKGRDGKRKSDLKAVQQALQLYLQKNGSYPNQYFGQIMCSGDSAGKDWGKAFTCGSITYMQQLPKDPLSKSQTDGYYYFVTPPNPKTYSLSEKLENSNDPDSQNQPSDCIPGGDGRNYCVTNP